MNLGDRKKQILRAVIDQYVDTAEPVGSKSISAALSLSPATIRNEMAELEAFGLLEQPHKSAGRVPTATGYRIYVDELMRRHRLSLEETEELNRALRRRLEELDNIIAYAGRIASRLTSFPAYALAASKSAEFVTRFEVIEVDSQSFIAVLLLSGGTTKSKLVRMPSPVPEGMLTRAAALFNVNFTNIRTDMISESLLESTARAMSDTIGLTAVIAQFFIESLSDSHENEFSLAGSARIFDYPEFHDVTKARKLLDYLSNDDVAPLLPVPDAGSRVKITIGPENLAVELRDSSVVAARYEMDGGVDLLIGVVGPTRMDYSRVLSQLQYLTRGFAKTPPDTEDKSVPREENPRGGKPNDNDPHVGNPRDG